MSQCQRCGATNEPTSKFCVACGAPLPGWAAPGEAGAQRPPPPSPTAPPPAPAAYPVALQPRVPPQPSIIQGAEGQPPSSSLQYAATASPPTREEFEQAQAAARAAHLGAFGSAQPSPSAYAPGVQPATAAMPGVSQDPEAIAEGSPRILAGFLVSYDVQALGRFWPIYQGRTRIGRQGAAPDLDLELDHPTASSRHAVVLASACPGRIKLEDTGSTNGTLVNGTRLTPGVRVELRDGDRVRFGLLSTVVKIV